MERTKRRKTNETRRRDMLDINTAAACKRSRVKRSTRRVGRRRRELRGGGARSPSLSPSSFLMPTHRSGHGSYPVQALPARKSSARLGTRSLFRLALALRIRRRPGPCSYVAYFHVSPARRRRCHRFRRRWILRSGRFWTGLTSGRTGAFNAGDCCRCSRVTTITSRRCR